MKNKIIKNSNGHRKTAHMLITGMVQGVGFRPFIHRMAVEHSITGKVYNRSGSVFIESTGFQEQLETFFKNIKNNKSGQWSISSISINYVPTTSDYKEFFIAENIIKYYKELPAASILHQLSLKINIHSSSGAGRLFDAAASILGICHISTYESEAAMKLEEHAYNKEPSSLYEYEIKKSGEVYIVNLIPAFKQLWDKKMTTMHL